MLIAIIDYCQLNDILNKCLSVCHDVLLCSKVGYAKNTGCRGCYNGHSSGKNGFHLCQFICSNAEATMMDE